MSRSVEPTEPRTAEEDVCAICFELQPMAKLPCACRMSYCAPCWDRALAASVAVRGRPQCPSCRCVFSVDFDVVSGEIELRGLRDEFASGGNWKKRMYWKTRERQIELLRQYGDQLVAPSPEESEDSTVSSTACSDSSGRPEGAASDVEALPAASPLCVCGGLLERIDGVARVQLVLDENRPGWRLREGADRIVKSLTKRPLVTCDLCGEIATLSGSCWTCPKGSRTLLHLDSYDVCEHCFAAHVRRPAPPRSPRARHVLSMRRSSHHLYSRCRWVCLPSCCLGLSY